MTVQAYLQATNKSGEAPLNVRYFHDGVFFPIGIGYSIRPEYFDKKKQTVLDSHPDHKVLNYQLTLVKNRMLEIAQQVQIQGMEPSREVVKAGYLRSLEERPYPYINTNTVDNLPVIKIIEPIPKQKPEPAPVQPKPKKKKVTSEDFITKIEDFTGLTEEFVYEYYQFGKLVSEWIDTNTNIGKRTRNQRRSWLKITTDFALKTKTSLAFDNFTMKFYSTYAQWLMYDSEHNLFNNAFGTLVKRLKTFLGWVEDIKEIPVHKHYKKFRVLSEEKQIENACLDRWELELLWHFDTQHESKRDQYQKVIDLTYLQCSIGLRWSDLTNPDGLELIEVNGQKVLTGKTAKSNFKQTYQIPLSIDARIEGILEKYDYNVSKVMSDVEYNRRVKEVLKELYARYQLHQKTYRIYRYKLNERFAFDYYKYQMIASHSNRRAFVSWCYKELRLPEKMILLMMGSKSNQELKKYISLDTTDIIHAVSALNLTQLKVA